MDYKDFVLDEIQLEHEEWEKLRDQYAQKYPHGGDNLRYLTHPALPYYRLRLMANSIPHLIIDVLPPKFAQSKVRELKNGFIAATKVTIRIYSEKIPSEVVVDLCTVTDSFGEIVGFTDFAVKKPSMLSESMSNGLAWMAVCLIQDALINRPTVFHTQLYRRSSPKKSGSKNSNRVKVVKIITLIPDSLEPKQPESSGHTYVCPCWGVIGHWRTYKKTGRRVWIEPYTKGKQRNTNSISTPRQYELVIENEAPIRQEVYQ